MGVFRIVCEWWADGNKIMFTTFSWRWLYLLSLLEFSFLVWVNGNLDYVGLFVGFGSSKAFCSEVCYFKLISAFHRASHLICPEKCFKMTKLLGNLYNRMKQNLWKYNLIVKVLKRIVTSNVILRCEIFFLFVCIFCELCFMNTIKSVCNTVCPNIIQFSHWNIGMHIFMPLEK